MSAMSLLKVSLLIILYCLIGNIFSGILSLILLVLGIAYFLFRNNRQAIQALDFVWASLFSLLAGLPAFLRADWFLLLVVILTTFISFVVSMATFRSHQVALPILRYSYVKTLGIILLCGGTLALINLGLGRLSGAELMAQSPIQALINSLQPGIWEEVGFRLIFLAFVVQLLKGLPSSRMETVLTYLLMTFPHAVAHFPPGQLVSAIVWSVLMSLIFGLPLAFLLKKVDLTTAVGSHILIDWVRFTFLSI